VSRTPARHQKGRSSPVPAPRNALAASPDRLAAARHRKPSSHRKPSPVATALQHKRLAAAVAGSTLLVSAATPMVIHWSTSAPQSAALDQAQALSSAGSGPDGAQANAGGATEFRTDGGSSEWAHIPAAQVNAAREADARRAAAGRAAAAAQAAAGRAAAQREKAQQAAAAAATAYRNPLRSVSGLIPERVDMGVDFGGAGPVYAIGDAVITNATASNSGWPGGGWITYQLTSGPGKGLMVYVAEDVTPAVQVGQTVTSSTVIANMFNGGDGIETGWAMPDGASAESQLPEAGGISGGGPFPTMVGLNFEALLQALGVPAAPNAGQAGNGTLPSNYPTDWTAATKP